MKLDFSRLYALKPTSHKELEQIKEGVLALARGEEKMPMYPEKREELGKVVRAAWIEWAMQQPNPKPSWLVPYEQLDEADKEADRLIGQRVFEFTSKALYWSLPPESE